MCVCVYVCAVETDCLDENKIHLLKSGSFVVHLNLNNLLISVLFFSKFEDIIVGLAHEFKIFWNICEIEQVFSRNSTLISCRKLCNNNMNMSSL